MRVLALDVDGVLLDPNRGGAGPWNTGLDDRFGISPTELHAEFFAQSWSDVIVGRLDVETALGEALTRLGSSASSEAVLDYWFEADFFVVESTVDLARRAIDAGIAVVLATNQEHRRAAYLQHRFGAMFALNDVYYSAGLGFQKHEPAFFTLATQRLDVPPEDIVFVDDHLHNVHEARRAGWSAVHAETLSPAETLSHAETLSPASHWQADVAALLGL